MRDLINKWPLAMIAALVALLAACGPSLDAGPEPISQYTATQAPPTAAPVADADGESAEPTTAPLAESRIDAHPADENADRLNYVMHVPAGYQDNRAEGYPLLIMLHGSGLELAGFAEFQALPLVPPLLTRQPYDFPFLVLLPQLPADSRWSEQLDALNNTLDDALATYNIDEARLHVSGFSLGGAGAVAWAIDQPQRFASLVSVAGYWPYNENPHASFRTCTIKDMPMWLVHSAVDTDVSVDYFIQLRTALEACPAPQLEKTLYTDTTHQDTFARAYTDEALYTWLLAQRLDAERDVTVEAAPRPAPDLIAAEADEDLTLTQLGYMVSVPAEYDPQSAQGYPTVIMLHGSDAGGLDIEAFAQNNGLLDVLAGQPAAEDFIIVMPQGAPGATWTTQHDLLDAMLADVLAEYAVNEDRLLLAGFSMGASGAYAWALDQPERFAALVPISGSWPSQQGAAGDPRTCELADTPLWLFHGEGDTTIPPLFSREVKDALDACTGGADVQLTLYPGLSHTATPVEAFSEAELWRWLADQSR